MDFDVEIKDNSVLISFNEFSIEAGEFKTSINVLLHDHKKGLDDIQIDR